jgi:hypothetical protein
VSRLRTVDPALVEGRTLPSLPGQVGGEQRLMPRIDISGWLPEAVEEQVDRLKARGAEPEVIVSLRWLSAVERAQRDADLEDEKRCRALKRDAVKGGAKSYGARSRGY